MQRELVSIKVERKVHKKLKTMSKNNGVIISDVINNLLTDFRKNRKNEKV